jgi:flagellar hook-associated protein 2
LGDFTTRTLSDQVRAQLSATIASATGTYSSLSEIGIEVQTGGKLKLNTTTFQAAMAADSTSVQAIFVDRTDSGSTLTGFASSMDTLLESFTSSTGSIADRTSSIQDQIEDIASEQTAFLSRMDGVEARYRSQFNALDSLLAEIQATQDYLTTALDQLPGFVRDTKK